MGNHHKKAIKDNNTDSNKIIKKENNIDSNKNNNDQKLKEDESDEYFKDKFRFIRILNKKRMKVINISLLNDGRICTCHAYDIYIYNDKYEEELIIPVIKKCHCQIQLKNDLLVLGGYDLEIIKLEINNAYKIIQVIEPEHSIVSIIEISNSNFIVGSLENIIKIYKMNEKTKKYEISQQIDNSHLKINGITLCLIKEKQFASASDINCVNFYDFNYEKINLIMSIKDIECGTNQKTLCLLNNILIVGGKNSKGFYLINLKNYSLIGIINGFNIKEVNTIIKMKNSHNIIVGILDENCRSNLYKFKFENNTLIKTKELYTSFDFDIIYGISEIDNNNIAYGCYNGMTVIIK